MATRREFLLGVAGSAAELFLLSKLNTKAALAQELNKPVSPKSQAPIPSTDIVSIITNLDNEIFNDPNKLESVIGDISDIGCRVAAKELAVDFNALRDKQNFLDEKAFKNKLEEVTPCIDTVIRNDVLGATVVTSKEVFMNLDALRHNRRRVAREALHVTIHEAHHQADDLIIPEHPRTFRTTSGEQVISEMISGGTYLVRRPDKDKDGRECFTGLFIELDEAIGEHSTYMTMLVDLGFRNVRPSYEAQVYAYMNGVINRFMMGDYRELRHIKTKNGVDKFFEELGIVIQRSPLYTDPLILKFAPDVLARNYVFGLLPKFERED